MRYLLPLVLLCGCSVQGLYVEADRLTFEAVAHEYRDYVSQDETLTLDQQDRRFRTIRGWEARLEEAE